MFDWMRKKRKDGRAPWSEVLNARQEERLEALVNAQLAAMGESGVVEDGWVRVGETKCGLENLAQVCLKLAPDEWPEHIEQHFDALRRSEGESKEWASRSFDFDWVAPQLCVRIHPNGYRDTDGERIALDELALTRIDLPELQTVLVADRPSSIVTVEREATKEWPLSPDQVFELAIRNLAVRYPVEIEGITISEESGTLAFALSGEHMFVASHALRLDAWPEFIGPHGTLFSVPNRHTLLVHAIESANVLDAIKALAFIGYNACVEGPGSIAPDLYWRTRDGKFARMEVNVDDKSIGLKPSDEFKALLEALTG